MKLYITVLFFLIIQSLTAQPKHEIRAAWLTTNYGLDWPKKPFRNSEDINQQKRELDRILDQLKEININMVFIQARIRGDVIYPSKIEPRSEYIKSIGATADYDPLQYAIDACRKRGIECHAWMVVYPMGLETQIKKSKPAFMELKRKNLLKTFNGNLYLDPGNPQTDDYLLSLINELVTTYDIDGIHFDYIRYPDTPARFPDNDTFQRLGKGKKKDDWRRENVNRFIYSAYDAVKAIKPWVQVSSSVVGMYKAIQGSGQRHWTAHGSVFQDPVDWINKNKHDFIVPMNYYSGRLFNPYIHDWVSRINDRFVVPGLGVFQMDEKELRWDAAVLYDQVEFSREAKTHGNAFFRTAHILDHSGKFGKGLSSRFYHTPALLPPLSWLNAAVPEAPADLSAYKTGSFLRLEWEKATKADNGTVFYNLYRSEVFPVDINNPQNLVAVRLPDNFYQLPTDHRIESGYYYVATSFDRYRNESVCSKAVYFVTGEFEK